MTVCVCVRRSCKHVVDSYSVMTPTTLWGLQTRSRERTKAQMSSSDLRQCQGVWRCMVRELLQSPHLNPGEKVGGAKLVHRNTLRTRKGHFNNQFVSLPCCTPHQSYRWLKATRFHFFSSSSPADEEPKWELNREANRERKKEAKINEI